MDHKLRPPRHNLNSMTELREKSWLTLNFRHVCVSAPRALALTPTWRNVAISWRESSCYSCIMILTVLLVCGVMCGQWNWMQLRLRLWSPGHVQFISSQPHWLWTNCAEGVCWPCYIGCVVWCWDYLWEASCFRAAAQRLFIFRKSWQVFLDGSHLLRSFKCFVLPVSSVT